MRHELSFATAAAGAEEVEVAVAVVVGVEDSICFLGCSVVVRASSPQKGVVSTTLHESLKVGREKETAALGFIFGTRKRKRTQVKHV